MRTGVSCPIRISIKESRVRMHPQLLDHQDRDIARFSRLMASVALLPVCLTYQQAMHCFRKTFQWVKIGSTRERNRENGNKHHVQQFTGMGMMQMKKSIKDLKTGGLQPPADILPEFCAESRVICFMKRFCASKTASHPAPPSTRHIEFSIMPPRRAQPVPLS